MLRDYYRLIKPGIIRGNILVAAAAFVYASDGHINYATFGTTLLGTSLIIASACVYNNFLDRELDKQMARTAKRALVTGTIKTKPALIYGTILGLIGVFALGKYVNILTMAIGLFGWLMYVVVYGYFKRRTVHGTVVGSISGALPPVAGYAAVTGHLDVTAGLLFLMLVLWQMPHFYAIAIYRLNDYRKAKLPVLPIVSGIKQTKIQMLVYVIAYSIVCISFSMLGYASWIFAVVNGLYGATWVYIGISTLKRLEDAKWARKMFFVSLIGLPVLSLMLAVNPLFN